MKALTVKGSLEEDLVVLRLAVHGDVSGVDQTDRGAGPNGLDQRTGLYS